MNVIVFSKRRGNSKQFNLLHPKPLLTFLTIASSALLAVFFGGYMTAARSLDIEPDVRIVQLHKQLAEQDRQIEETKRKTQENVDALSVQLGRMQAHVIRLDALGRRLTEMAQLPDSEFNFEIPPAQGGPEPTYGGQVIEPPHLGQMLEELSEQIRDRQQQLGVLADVLMNRNLQEQVSPKGRPVKSGYISSYFGRRADPFTGKTARHKGIDFAGRKGAEIIAVAAGVVTWSGSRYGFGELVEIDHGNGYVTRYAHNEENLVDVGHTVLKGQTIALMGDSGRATGPNLHFEVLHDDRVVDPISFIRASDPQ